MNPRLLLLAISVVITCAKEQTEKPLRNSRDVKREEYQHDQEHEEDGADEDESKCCYCKRAEDHCEKHVEKCENTIDKCEELQEECEDCEYDNVDEKCEERGKPKFIYGN